MSEPDSDEPEAPLTPSGNRPRLLRGGLLFALGAVASVCLMALDRQLRFGVPLGLFTSSIAALGALDLAGSFDDPDDTVETRTTARALAAPAAAALVSAVAFFALLTLATRGTLGVVGSALLVPSSLLALVITTFRLGEALGPLALDESGQRRPLHLRHGFWLVALATLIYVPMAGNHSLTDPWETHYGEVSREVLARDDWISTWWAQDGWFFSKPVLNFWMQALAMASLGVRYQPGQMLDPMGGASPRPEWAVRMPVVLLTIIALYLLYKGVSRVFGRRAGLLGAVVLMTMPQWAFLSHQTMADMPFVAALSSAMGLLLLGIYTPEEERATTHEITLGKLSLRLSLYHAVFFAVLLCALPQAFYLVSRNVDLITSGELGFSWHRDTFWAGSKGNCGLPGNELCTQHRPTVAWAQPGLQGLAWAAVAFGLLWLNWGERRRGRLFFIAGMLFAAISTLGKGPAGILLPVLCAFAYVGVTGRFRDLLRYELLSGALVIAAVALPWYAAMYARHGAPFIDRLIFHDMWKRALTHVHDTNEGDDVSFRFYIWQLGYAFFPWTGLAPLGLTFWARRPDDHGKGQGDASVFLAMWFVFAFALFTWMLTKFHHYIFPAVPPAAMLTGIALDRLYPRALSAKPLDPLRLASIAAGAVSVALAIASLYPGSFTGHRGEGGLLAPPSYALSFVLLTAGLTALAFGAMPLVLDREAIADTEPEPSPQPRGAEDAPVSLPPKGDVDASPYRLAASDEAARVKKALEVHEGLVLAAFAFAGALLLALVGRDLVVRPEGDVPGDVRFLHLFTYNYKRAWPDTLDFSAVFAGTTASAVLCMLLLTARRLRAVAAVSLTAIAVVFCAFTIDVYFVKTSPHWGQRETIEAYFRLRRGPEEPIVAYQMNWKGENFYTGNRLPTFVSTGDKFKNWVKEQRERGTRTMFFTTEHTRVPTLRSELGNPDQLEIVTPRSLNNKFTLVRVRFEG